MRSQAELGTEGLKRCLGHPASSAEGLSSAAPGEERRDENGFRWSDLLSHIYDPQLQLGGWRI